MTSSKRTGSFVRAGPTVFGMGLPSVTLMGDFVDRVRAARLLMGDIPLVLHVTTEGDSAVSKDRVTFQVRCPTQTTPTSRQLEILTSFEISQLLNWRLLVPHPDPKTPYFLTLNKVTELKESGA